tara:strand:- start:464 stop:820 length:357 start_codon:yes stop_codon:yes gene_type:complete
MSEKEVLVNMIKEWVVINNKMIETQKILKELRLKKQNISNSLIKIMENNDIDGIDINNGKLIHRKNKIKAPINKDYLYKMLDGYFTNYPEVDSDHVSNFLLDNRPIKEKSVLSIKEKK